MAEDFKYFMKVSTATTTTPNTVTNNSGVMIFRLMQERFAVKVCSNEKISDTSIHHPHSFASQTKKLDLSKNCQ